MVSLPFIGAEDEIASIYATHVRLVRDIARCRFYVPREALDDVVQEVFLSYFLARDSVRDVRSWLVGAACNACRRYWMVHHARKEAPLPLERPGPDEEAFLRALTVRQIVQRLPSPYRQTLKLHYFEGLTDREVARRLGTTTRYAKKLIHESLREAFRMWTELR